MSVGFAVTYAKAVDDKEIGIYLEGIYFGGVGEDKNQADEVARRCINTVKGGTVLVKIIPIDQICSLLEVFKVAKERFDRMERQMVETEAILEANAKRSKKRRK